MRKYSEAEEEKSSFDTIMSLPDEIFEQKKDTPEPIYDPGVDDISIHHEDLAEDIALQLIGENQQKPNCVYKLITTRYRTYVAQFDNSKESDDQDYVTEYELEEYKEGYRDQVDQYSVSSGFWQGTDVPKKISPMLVIAIVMILLLATGIGIWVFLLSLA